MKKIISILVLSALLLVTLGISASAAAYFDYGNLNTRVTVKKSDSVKIDGVISEGEYEEYTDCYTEWYVAENASDYFEDAEKMAKTAKWYFSWDGEYLNIAAQYDAGQGANQTFAGGDYYGDYAYAGTDEFVMSDHFLGYGPGLNIKSAEVSPADEAWTKLFYAIGENTATGEKITATYSDQNGQNLDYKASHDDFEFVYDGTIVTVEYRLPIYELYGAFQPNKGGQMFKASIVLQAGVAGNVEVEDGVEVEAPLYGWGVRLGQFGYNCDSGNLDKVHATFRLVDEEIPQPSTPDKTPVQPPVTTPQPPVTTPDQPPVTTPEDNKPGETPDQPPVTTPEDNKPGETPDNKPVETPDNKPVETPDDTPVAPNTGDIMVVAAVVSAISACGVMFAKKRK